MLAGVVLCGFLATAVVMPHGKAGELLGNTPEEAAARVQRESEKWKRVVDRLGLKAD